MSEKDKQLIKQAESISYVDWHIVDDLMVQADSEEAKSKLKSIRSHLYHTEEYYAGCL